MNNSNETQSIVKALEVGDYRLNLPDELETPAFLVYENKVRHNIQEILRVCGSPERVVPHVKTHKSVEVLKLQMEAGMTSFKCATLKEAEMLAEGGVKEIIIAYPLLHTKKIRRFVTLKQKYPATDIKAIVSRPEHLLALSEAAGTYGTKIGVYIDLDTGMRRTGVQPGRNAGDFYALAAGTPGLETIGVHVFDGQALYKPCLSERKALVNLSLDYIHDLWDQARKRHLDVIDNIVAGSWSFHLYLDEKNIRVSPGTWIYWDSRNAGMSDLNFKIAAVVLGQVIDQDIEQDTVTTDIGSKAASPDQPTDLRFKIVGHDQAVLIAQSEEHGVVKLNGESLKVGDFILAAPGHACTTTVKYPYAVVVDLDGDVVGRYGHQARDR